MGLTGALQIQGNELGGHQECELHRLLSTSAEMSARLTKYRQRLEQGLVFIDCLLGYSVETEWNRDCSALS